MKIKLTADSTIDLSQELVKKFDVEIIPLTVILGDKEHKDGIDICPDDIYRFVEKTGILPKTAATNPELFYEVFKRYTDEGYTVIHFSISNEMSMSFNNAMQVAKDFKNVYVVNGLNLSAGTALLLAYAHRLKEKEFDAQTIYDKVTSIIPNIQTSFVLDNLKFLHKGGRCSTLTLLGANLLKIKPCIAVKNGKMGVERKYRGNFEKVVEEYFNDTLKLYQDYDTRLAFITHTEISPKILERVKEILKEKSKFKKIIDIVVGSTVTSHCGKNTIGLIFVDKKLDY